ncbi:hypothetical protein SAMN05443144_1542 [Fodinibius roseus]|uniref:Sulfotransferase family protein n=1 Tax=Fodinibius roseus TaxID=1194090 RepID=A0A1M5M937_9BACT|nr:sulfotransferase family protein [Fodinibius roseus]SHG73758.1 hypothetical protein SAMN05443144_1542 [Fodinibius roseus]
MSEINKIFGIGFFKTGTVSLWRAIEYLGFTVQHGMVPQGEQIRINLANFVSPCLYGLPEADAYMDIDELRNHFDLLDREYPNSKFILTTRPLEDWLASVQAQKHKRRSPYYHAFEHQDPLLLKWHRTAHHNAVREYFADRPDDMLELKICEGEGWEKLCPFLGKPVPNISFPHENKSPTHLKASQ